MEQFYKRNSHRRVIFICNHNVGHHIPPFPSDGIDCGLRICVFGTLLISKEHIGLLIPKYTVITYSLMLYQLLLQFRPNGSMSFGILIFTSWF